VDISALISDIFLVSLFGGFVALDRRCAFQIMISQPIVAVPALGLMMGMPELGLWLGSVLQLVWMSSVLFGANVPPNETVASVAIGGMVFIFGEHIGEVTTPVWAVAILAGAPLSLLGRKMEIWFDRDNLRLLARADLAAAAGTPKTLTTVTLWGLARIFVANVIIIALGVAIGLGVLLVLDGGELATQLRFGLEGIGVYIIPALGLAVAFSVIRQRGALVVAAFCFVTTIALMTPGAGS
jgi:mannose/fructose/N-acetylgalactosamine-specific phosphotransferase system component IIC